ncbi:MAG: carboxylating nicotinate-nucleotide diphosphorylase [Chloroflexota bacterium]
MLGRQIVSLSEEQIDRVVAVALEEDIGRGDVTSQLLLPPGLVGKATLLVKASGVLAGGEVARRVFHQVDPLLEVELRVPDGSQVERGDTVGTISGSVAGILRAERVALNFLQRLSGIATLTSQYMTEVKGTRAVIVDTRKTTPGLRVLEKYAVRMGGGQNHRFNLADGILIKDNHLASLRALGMGFREAVAKAREKAPPGLKVEVEVTSLPEAQAAAQAGADIILLDNMSPAEMKRVVELLGGRVLLEASGGVTLANVRQVAETGVDIISVGALTHSPRALDISLELDPQTLKLF